MPLASGSFTIDLRRLGVLRELGRRGILARAAEALHLTHSAISQQVATLSREIGMPWSNGLRMVVVEAEPPDLFTRLEGGEIEAAVAVDFAAALPRTDPRSHRTELLVDVLDLALPAAHRSPPGRSRRCLQKTHGSSVTPAAAVGRSPGRSVRLRASHPRSGMRSTSGRRWPHWSARASTWFSFPGWPTRSTGPELVLRPLAQSSPARHVFASVRAGSGADPVLPAVPGHLREAGVELAARECAG